MGYKITCSACGHKWSLIRRTVLRLLAHLECPLCKKWTGEPEKRMKCARCGQDFFGMDFETLICGNCADDLWAEVIAHEIQARIDEEWEWERKQKGGEGWVGKIQ